MSKLSQMLLDERGSLWIPSIECSRSCDAPLTTCVRVNVRWKEEEKGDRRGWTKTRKDAGGRIEHLQLNAQTQNSIIKASNIQSKDNFNCAGAQNDCTVYTNSTWRTRKPLRTSVTPGGKLWRRRREHWEVEPFWLTHATTPATAAESTQWQIVKHIITG